jgi:predicted ester cyclase
MPNLRHYYDEVWKALIHRDFDKAAKHFSDNSKFILPGVSATGFKSVRPYFEAYLEAFPDARMEVQHTVTDRENLVVRSSLTGKHTGKLVIGAVELPPTGRTVTWENVEWLTVMDSKIITWYLYQDSTPFMQALNNVQEARARARACIASTVEAV